MDDLISRSAAIDALMEQPKLTRSVIRRVLRQVPAVDALLIPEEVNGHAIKFIWQKQDGRFVTFAPVIRCKDCKYYEYGKNFPDIKFCCRLKDKNGEPARYNFSDDDFCSRGERREDNAAD